MCEQFPRTTKPETALVKLNMYKGECCNTELRFNRLLGAPQCHVGGVLWGLADKYFDLSTTSLIKTKSVSRESGSSWLKDQVWEQRPLSWCTVVLWTALVGKASITFCGRTATVSRSF